MSEMMSFISNHITLLIITRNDETLGETRRLGAMHLVSRVIRTNPIMAVIDVLGLN